MRKIIATTLFFAALFCAYKSIAVFKREDSNEIPQFLYSNSTYSYELVFAEKYAVDESIPELVSISDSSSSLRINAGCYESGTETLGMEGSGLIEINGTPALKEEYSSNGGLRLRKIFLNDKHNKCFLLEEAANTELGWQELEQIRSSFRFID